MGRGGRGGRGRGGGGRGGKRKASGKAGGGKGKNKFQKLSQKDREHVGEFGEMHPVDEFSLTDHDPSEPPAARLPVRGGAKPVARVPEPVYDDYVLDEEDEEPAYNKLVSTLRLSGAHAKLLARRRREERGKEKTAVAHEVMSASEADLSDDDASGSQSHDEDGSEHSSGDVENDTMVDAEGGSGSEDDGELAEGEGDDIDDDVIGTDPYAAHFDNTTCDVIDATRKDNWETDKCSTLGPMIQSNLGSDYGVHSDDSLLRGYRVKKRLADVWQSSATHGKLTDMQKEVLTHITCYRDVCAPLRTPENGQEIRELYCMHALNHVLKTRSRILRNNERLREAARDGKDIGEVRDQGFTRPKVLILAPMRNAAYAIVNTLLDLYGGSKIEVANRKRFREEFGPDDEDENAHNERPADYRALFTGNADDCFSICLSLGRKNVKLYSNFYRADIIVVSPLALRLMIGSAGDKKRDYDMLSSIEVAILDQADVFLMQNWEHVMHIFAHMNLLPKEQRDTDFSRLREFYINGLARCFRQTLIFCQFLTPEINALFAKHARSFEGKVKYTPEYDGTIRHVVNQTQQIFQRLECAQYSSLADLRFNFFINEVLPPLRNSLNKHIAIFVPSYFDFVRLRNYFKKEEISFSNISEYTLDKDISRARTNLFHGRRQFMIFTERFHFFRRYRIRGIKHLIFYELPVYAHFYPELVNFMDTSDSDCKVSVLYTRFEALRLDRIVGTTRARKMMTSTKDVHLFC